MTKAELLSQLENCKNNFILSLAGLAAVSDPRGAEILKSAQCQFGGFSIDFGRVAAMFNSPADGAIAVREATLAAFRALLKESFELVRSFSEDTGQEQKFKAFTSYKYHRLVRHALSHDFRWNLKNNKGKLYEYLPLEPWRLELRGLVATIDASMHDQPMKLQELPFEGMWQLFVDLNDGVRTSLD